MAINHTTEMGMAYRKQYRDIVRDLEPIHPPPPPQPRRIPDGAIAEMRKRYGFGDVGRWMFSSCEDCDDETEIHYDANTREMTTTTKKEREEMADLEKLREIMIGMADNMDIMNKNMIAMDERIDDLENMIAKVRWNPPVDSKPMTTADLPGNQGVS